MDGKFVAYYRVSTVQQVRSGLGLEAQRKAVADFLDGGSWALLAEFTEQESGKVNDRPELARALERCRLTGATLVIAKLDRLSRNAAFLLSLRDAGVDFVAADMPQANRLTIGIMALVAEQEREAISARTKAALAAAKVRGVKLGNPQGFDGKVYRKGGGAARSRADAFAARLAPMIREHRRAGMSLHAIAAKLEADGIRTARGGAWTATAVRTILLRTQDAAAP